MLGAKNGDSMGPRLSAVLGALLALGAIRETQRGDYVWAALGFAVAIGCALRAYQLWKREPT